MVDVHPVTPERWDDLVRLFGANGAYANCWCMWWRVTAAAFDEGDKNRGAGNRAAMKALLAAAADHVARSGGRLLEGYPVHPDGKTASASAYTGVASMFGAAGFEQIARRKATGPSICRRRVSRS